MSSFTKELLKEFKIQKFWKVLISSLLGIIFTVIISPVILDKLLNEAEKSKDEKLILVCKYLKNIAYLFTALFIAMFVAHIYLVRTRVRLCWIKSSERQLQRQLLTTQEQKQQLESLLVVPNESQIERLQASRPQSRLSSGSRKPSPSGSPITLPPPPPSTTAQTERLQVTRARSRFSSGSGDYSPSGSPIAQPPPPSTTAQTERLQVTRAQSRFSSGSGNYSPSGSPIAQLPSPSTTAQTGRKATRAQPRLSCGSGNYSPNGSPIAHSTPLSMAAQTERLEATQVQSGLLSASGNYSPNSSPIVQLPSPSTTDSPTHLVRRQTTSKSSCMLLDPK